MGGGGGRYIRGGEGPGVCDVVFVWWYWDLFSFESSCLSSYPSYLSIRPSIIVVVVVVAVVVAIATFAVIVAAIVAARGRNDERDKRSEYTRRERVIVGAEVRSDQSTARLR
jgi:TRAP-type mannitol/chloroaromatic compound transport system permease small subunit